MKLLIIEDNPQLSGRMKQQLRKWYITESVDSGEEGLRLASTGLYDCLILDLGLPDMSGSDVCRQLRRLSIDTPILVLTGVDETASKVTLLEAGADDYLTKPFAPEELRARINALLRRKNRSQSIPLITIGDLTINPSRRNVQRAGKDIQLRRKEYDILEYLASNSGRILSRELIINHAWPSAGSSWIGSVDVHIKQLRDKVDKPFTYPLIKTAYGVGYYIDTPQSGKEGPRHA